MSPRDGALRWTIAGVAVAFSTAEDGDVRDPGRRSRFLERIRCDVRCVAPRQVHGAGVADAEATDVDLAASDGLATTDPTIALAVFGADCPGLVLVARDALAVAHCGWRGAAAGIVSRAIDALSARTTDAIGAWSAFIGPGVCGRHYEVDAPVLTARRWPDAAISGRREDRAQLDLATAIAHDLAQAGVTRIERCGVCTAEDPRLWSYRRRGAGLVQALVAWRPRVSGVADAASAPG